jgi:hypothetical protein
MGMIWPEAFDAQPSARQRAGAIRAGAGISEYSLGDARRPTLYGPNAGMVNAQDGRANAQHGR